MPDQLSRRGWCVGVLTLPASAAVAAALPKPFENDFVIITVRRITVAQPDRAIRLSITIENKTSSELDIHVDDWMVAENYIADQRGNKFPLRPAPLAFIIPSGRRIPVVLEYQVDKKPVGPIDVLGKMRWRTIKDFSFGFEDIPIE